MSILEKLYFGKINPAVRSIIQESEYQKLNERLIRDIDEFMVLLNHEEKQLYKKISNHVIELNCISDQESFIEGFRIGVQLMWETLHFKSENFL